MSVLPLWRRLGAALALAGLALAVTGCADQLQRSDSFLGLVTPYRVEVVQGNVVTKEQLDKVKEGMTRNQVRDILGSPLVNDVFHLNRWDYVFTLVRPGTERQRRALTFVFDGDRLAKIESPALPTEPEFVAAISPRKDAPVVPPLALTEEQRKALPVPPKVDEPASAPVGPVRPYPPLEKP